MYFEQKHRFSSHLSFLDFPSSSWLAQNQVSAQLIDILLIFIGAVLVNNMCNRLRIMRDQNLFPGLIWVFLHNLYPSIACHSPIIISNLLVLIAIWTLLSQYKKAYSRVPLLRVGFLMGLSMLFWLPSALGIITVLIGKRVLMNPKWEDYASFLFGILSPLILMFTYLFAIGEELTLLAYLQSWAIYQPVIQIFPWPKALSWGTALVFSTLPLIFYNLLHNKVNIQIDKYLEVLYWVLLISGISLFLIPSWQGVYFTIVIFPLAIFGGMLFHNMSKSAAELVHLLLIAHVLFWQYGPLALT